MKTLSILVLLLSSVASAQVRIDVDNAAERFNQSQSVVEFGDCQVTVLQVIDDSNARIEVQAFTGQSIGTRFLEGKPVELWFQGSTAGMSDGERIERLPKIRKSGTTTYETVLGAPRTIAKVIHLSPAEEDVLHDEWLKAHPEAYELTLKDGPTAWVIIHEYKKGKVTIESMDMVVTIKMKDFDSRSRKAINAWKASR